MKSAMVLITTCMLAVTCTYALAQAAPAAPSAATQPAAEPIRFVTDSGRVPAGAPCHVSAEFVGGPGFEEVKALLAAAPADAAPSPAVREILDSPKFQIPAGPQHAGDDIRCHYVVYFTAPSPELAKETVYALIKLYQGTWNKDPQAFVRSQLSAVEAKLRDLGPKLKAARELVWVGENYSVPEHANDLRTRLLQLKVDRAGLDVRLEAAKKMLDEVSKQAAADKTNALLASRLAQLENIIMVAQIDLAENKTRKEMVVAMLQAYEIAGSSADSQLQNHVDHIKAILKDVTEGRPFVPIAVRGPVRIHPIPSEN